MFDPKLFPTLCNGWVIKGTKEMPRLYNLNTNKVVKLNNQVLEYITICNGTNSYEAIAETYSIPLETVRAFYTKFLRENILENNILPQKKEISVSLGRCEPWLKEVHIDTTNNCNLRCRHCFWGENLKNEQNMPFEQWSSFIDQLGAEGVGRVVLSGGEAMTNRDLLKIIKKCVSQKIAIASIFTNGTIFNSQTKEIIDFICDNLLTTTFYISLDGRCKEEHDFIRGEGCFDKTIGFIRYLVAHREKTKASYKILINSLIHKQNYKNLIEWYNILSDMGVDGWRFTTGRESGFMKKNAAVIKLHTEECFDEYLELVKYIVNLHNTGKPVMYVNIENFFNSRMLDKKKAYIFDKSLCICDYKTHACSVDPHGNVQFCTGWQSKKYGNVFTENIMDIWYSEELRKLKRFKIEQITECQDCKYLKYCGGGCRLECRDLQSKDSELCAAFKLYEEKMVPILKNNGIEFVLD